MLLIMLLSMFLCSYLNDTGRTGTNSLNTFVDYALGEVLMLLQVIILLLRFYLNDKVYLFIV